jgi:hypothetical protein
MEADLDKVVDLLRTLISKWRARKERTFPILIYRGRTRLIRIDHHPPARANTVSVCNIFPGS